MSETKKRNTKKKIATNDNKLESIRVNKDIKTILDKELKNLKGMKKGSKRISVSDILELLLPLFTEEHRKKLLSGTITGKNRHEIAFENYIKKHKGVSEDDFFDLVQYGEIQIDDYLPDEMKRQKRVNNIENRGVA